MLLHQTSTTGLVFPSQSKWVHSGIYDLQSQWIAQHQKSFCTKPSKFVLSSQSNAMIKTYKNINISVEYQCFCMKPCRTWLVFLSQSKWDQIVVCYDQNLQKHKYLSTIWEMLLHETFRIGFAFSELVKCYDQNLQKHKYLAVGYQCFCMKPSEQSSFSQLSGQKWIQISVVCCSIKTYLKHEISQHRCISMHSARNLQNRLVFPTIAAMGPNSEYATHQNLQKHKYLSGISMLLHETFRTELVFPSQSKMSPN